MAQKIEGQNFVAEVTGSKLVITINLEGPTTTSGSGKSDVIATTRGNKRIDTNGEPVHIGLNVYRKK